MMLANNVLFYLSTVPTLIIKESIYEVSEDDGRVVIVVLCPEERIRSVNFEIRTSNNSATGKV